VTGRQKDNTLLTDPVAHFEKVYKPQLPGRSWWAAAGVSLPALWTAACLKNRNLDIDTSLVAINAIGGAHDTESGFFAPLLASLTCAAYLQKKVVASASTLRKHVQALEVSVVLACASTVIDCRRSRIDIAFVFRQRSKSHAGTVSRYCNCAF